MKTAHRGACSVECVFYCKFWSVLRCTLTVQVAEQVLSILEIILLTASQAQTDVSLIAIGITLYCVQFSYTVWYMIIACAFRRTRSCCLLLDSVVAMAGLVENPTVLVCCLQMAELTAGTSEVGVLLGFIESSFVVGFCTGTVHCSWEWCEFVSLSKAWYAWNHILIPAL